jgi:hypothetical protein
MPVSHRTKMVLAGVAVVVITLAAVFAFGFHRAWHKFTVEDNIHDVFFPVVCALYEYEHDQGAPAASLAQLVPKYVSQIPSSALVDSVQYTLLPDGKAWQLSLHSTALDPPRLYCCRSSNKYTAEEEKRVILRYHGVWVVLRDS